MNDSLSSIADAVRDARRIGLAAHVRPDGDAIGSLVAFAHSLKLAGKEVHALSEDGVPANLAFLPATEMVELSLAQPLDLDLAIALDTATKERLGERTVQALSGAPVLVNMDHHGSNPRYGHLNYIDVSSPATGQIVYEFLTGFGYPVDDTVRRHLYAAISTDTGSFQFSSTTPRTHRIIAEMIEAGLDASTLSQKLYHEHPLRRLHLMKAMLNEMKLSSDGAISSWGLTLETQRAVNMQPGDTEGLIDILRSIEGTQAVVFFEEMADGKIRASVRSKNPKLDVSKICAEFGGGGHRMASGARLRGPLADAEYRLLDTLKNEIERIR